MLVNISVKFHLSFLFFFLSDAGSGFLPSTFLHNFKLPHIFIFANSRQNPFLYIHFHQGTYFLFDICDLSIFAIFSGSPCAPPKRSFDDVVNQTKRQHIFSGKFQRFCCFSFGKKSHVCQRIAEEFSGEITVYHVFSSMNTLSPTPMPKAPPEAPSPSHVTQNRHLQLGDFKQVSCNGFSLSSFFCLQTWKSAWSIYKAQYGKLKRSAIFIKRRALRYPSGLAIPKLRRPLKLGKY